MSLRRTDLTVTSLTICNHAVYNSNALKITLYFQLLLFKDH